MDSSGLYPSQSSLSLGAGPSLNPIPFQGTFPGTPSVSLNTQNNWSDELNTTRGSVLNTDYFTGPGSVGPMPPQFGNIGPAIENMALGTGTIGTGTGAEGENSDEYWNALIDGELSLTSGSGERDRR